MIAVDTNIMIAFFQGDQGEDIKLLEEIIVENALFLPSPVVSELLSDPLLSKDIENVIRAIP